VESFGNLFRQSPKTCPERVLTKLYGSHHCNTEMDTGLPFCIHGSGWRLARTASSSGHNGSQRAGNALVRSGRMQAACLQFRATAPQNPCAANPADPANRHYPVRALSCLGYPSTGCESPPFWGYGSGVAKQPIRRRLRLPARSVAGRRCIAGIDAIRGAMQPRPISPPLPPERTASCRSFSIDAVSAV
jgi:hypothetical protein